MTKKEPIFDAHLEMFSWRADLNRKLDGYAQIADPEVQQKEVNAQALIRGGVKLGYFCVNTALVGNTSLNEIFYQIDCYRSFIRKNGDRFRLVLTGADLEATLAGDKTGLIIYLENIDNIDRRLRNFERIYEAGVRLIGLTWDRPSLIGGNHRQPRRGLTAVGEALIERMNARGVIVDLAHTSRLTFYAALALTKKPPVVTHAGCRSLADWSRNLDDDQLRALGERGGVAGIFLVPEYLQPRGERRKNYEQWFAHVKHAVDCAGIESVGLGSDLGGMLGHTPPGLSNAGQLQRLRTGLRKTGFSADQIRKILHDNFLRVTRDNLPGE